MIVCSTTVSAKNAFAALIYTQVYELGKETTLADTP